MFKKKGFTLIELLVVISIIAILAGVVLTTSISGAAQARDAQRTQEVYQVSHALQMYFSEEGKYPDNSDSGDVGCTGNWDAGSTLNGITDTFIQPLITEGFLTIIPLEDKQTR